jgi:hypothetical protein
MLIFWVTKHTAMEDKGFPIPATNEVIMTALIQSAGFQRASMRALLETLWKDDEKSLNEYYTKMDSYGAEETDRVIEFLYARFGPPIDPDLLR